VTEPQEFFKPRVVRRTATKGGGAGLGLSLRPGDWLRMISDYFGIGRGRKRLEPITSPAGLSGFLDTRASFVAQTSLYGYLRTRAGMRYPELFDDDPFVEGINVAKWHIWLDCLGDLSIHAGGLLCKGGGSHEAVRSLIEELVGEILARTGTPQDAGGAWPEHAQRLRERVAAVDLARFEDGEWAFTDSPASVVRWSPVLDQLKELDEEIVLNSVRFRWQEVRRDLRACLDVQALLQPLN